MSALRYQYSASPVQRKTAGLRIKISVMVLGGLLATLVTVGSGPPAFAAPPAVDQAGWSARKKVATLSDGVDLAYVEMGDPAGPPVVLLHGFTDNSRLWSILVPYLGKYRLLIPDHRGHGASSKPDCCYAPINFVHDLRLFMDALGMRKAAIVGSSMGSMVAQLFAAEHPEQTSAIVLAGSTGLAPMQRDHGLWSVLTNAAQPANADKAFLKVWSPAASPTPVDATFVRYFDAEMAAVPAHVWRAVIRELTDFPVARHAADVRAPVLILSGGKDPVFGPEHHRALQQAYPRAESHLLPDLGHNLVAERPDRVGALLDAFLSKHGRVLQLPNG